MTDEDEVVAYLLEIVGTRADAERAADGWGVRIHVMSEVTEKRTKLTLAVCPAEDAKDIFEWHEDSMPRLRAGKAWPGDLMRIEQPPTDVVSLDFTGEEKKRRPPLWVNNPRKIEYDKL